MLIKSKDVIGLAILSIENGEKLGEIKDIVYDPKKNKILALILENKGLFSDAKMILFEDIRSIGKDSIMVDSIDVIRKTSQVENKISELMNSDDHLISSKVITESGNEIGSISDIFFNTDSGCVIKLEISEGNLEDIQHGKKAILIDDLITVGKDAVIVRDSAEEFIEYYHEGKGLEGIKNSIENKSKDAMEFLKKGSNEEKYSNSSSKSYSNVEKDVELSQRRRKQKDSKEKLEDKA